MKIAILYIGIGRYVKFFEDFYHSCEQFFLKDTDKTYFFFTDKNILVEKNVHVIYQEDLGWPGNTLFRFKMFLAHKEELAEFDYIFFFNGNTLFLRPVTENEVIPTEKESYLVALSWTNIYTDNLNFPYERNEKSLAYIPLGSGRYYFQGGLNGGRCLEYLELLKTCFDRIEKDFQNGVIACSHDESHLNKYLLEKNVKVLGPEYGRPEEWMAPQNPKIIFRDKKKYLGRAFMRHLKKKTFLDKLLRQVSQVLHR